MANKPVPMPKKTMPRKPGQPKPVPLQQRTPKRKPGQPKPAPIAKKPAPAKKAPMSPGQAWKMQQDKMKRDLERKAARQPMPKSERTPMPAATPVKPDRRIAGRVARKSAMMRGGR